MTDKSLHFILRILGLAGVLTTTSIPSTLGRSHRVLLVCPATLVCTRRWIIYTSLTFDYSLTQLYILVCVSSTFWFTHLRISVTIMINCAYCWHSPIASLCLPELQSRTDWLDLYHSSFFMMHAWTLSLSLSPSPLPPSPPPPPPLSVCLCLVCWCLSPWLAVINSNNSPAGNAQDRLLMRGY